ncbi:MAG: SMC family ATPase [Candidatus Micrarchaeota archaeon]
MILSLKLRHWKSHESSELSFGKGTNLIIGAMGSGKTSIMDAVCFALYGTFPALKSRKVRLEDVVMQRPAKFSKAEVAMEFAVGDKAFVVSRSISGGASDAFLRDKTGSLLEGPQSQRVTEAVERLLRVDYELFTRSIYSEQNRIDYFIALGKGERKKQVDELLGIDKFEDARSTAATVTNRLKARKVELDSRLRQQDAQKIASEITVLRSELAGLEAKKNGAAASLRELEKKAAEAAGELSQTEEKERKYNDFEREKARAEALAKQHSASRDKRAAALSRKITRAELAEKTVVEKRVSEFKKALQELRQVEGQVKALREQAESAKRDSAALQDVIVSKRTQQELLDKLLKKRDEARKTLSEADSAAARAAAQLDSLRRQEADLLAQASETSGLRQKLTLLSDAENLLATARSDSNHLRELVASLNASSEQFESALQSLSTESASCPVCDSPLPAEKKARLSHEKTAALDKTRAEFDGARKRLAEAEEREKQLESDVSQALALKQRLSLAETAEEKRGGVRKSIASAESQARELSDKLSEAESGLKSAETSVDEARLLLEKAERREQLAAKASEAEARLTQAEGKAKALSQAAGAGVLEELEKKVVELTAAEEMFAEEDAAAEAEKKVAAVEACLKSLAFSAAELASKRKQAVEAASASSRASAEAEGMQKLFEEKQKLLASREEQAATLKLVGEEAALAQKRVEEMTAFHSALVETQSRFWQELVGAVY